MLVAVIVACEVGFSVAFGHSMIRWADQRFAYRFAGGLPPWKPPKSGWARTRYEWREWGKGLIGWLVAVSLLGLAVLLVGDSARTAELLNWILRLSEVMAIWFVVGPAWATVFPGRARD